MYTIFLHYCLLFMLQDTASLDEIRTSFVNDGLRWAMEPENKLIHLWKKVQRTEEALRESSMEVAN